MLIVAAIAHYQFATIHPYYDGNGRTARLLINLVLPKLGYGLKGIYSLEEYYATNLHDYYNALTKVRLKATDTAKETTTDHSALLREFDQRQKQVLSLFVRNKYITTREIADLLNIHPRTALNLSKKWLENDFIIRHGEANKSRKYELAEKWLRLV